MSKFYELIIKNFAQLSTTKSAFIFLIAIAIGYVFVAQNTDAIGSIDLSTVEKTQPIFKLTLISLSSLFISVIFVNTCLVIFTSAKKRFDEYNENSKKEIQTREQNERLVSKFKIFLSHISASERKLLNSLLKKEQMISTEKNSSVNQLIGNKFIKTELKLSYYNIIVAMNPLLKDIYIKYLKDDAALIFNRLESQQNLFNFLTSTLSKVNETDTVVSGELLYASRDFGFYCNSYGLSICKLQHSYNWYIEFECPEIKAAAEEYCNKEFYYSVILEPNGDNFKIVKQNDT